MTAIVLIALAVALIIGATALYIGAKDTEDIPPNGDPWNGDEREDK